MVIVNGGDVANTEISIMRMGVATSCLHRVREERRVIGERAAAQPCSASAPRTCRFWPESSSGTLDMKPQAGPTWRSFGATWRGLLLIPLGP